MKFVEYKVNNMAVVKDSADKTVILSGAKNYFGIHFTFDDEFSSLAGAKYVEIFKNKDKERIELVDDQFVIPNRFIADKNSFEMRVTSGSMVATPWIQVQIVESGAVTPIEPDAPAQNDFEYVQSPIGSDNVPFLRGSATNGLEYSVDGITWQGGVNGVPEVPSSPLNLSYIRKNGDWVPFEPNQLIGIATAITDIPNTSTASTEDVALKVNELLSELRNRGIIL